jgi:hypothetical protein
MRDIISMMLKVDPKRRASTDELLSCDIIQKRIKSSRSNIISQGVQSKKANFIKTIKLPKNIHDINSVLPDNRYNPRETMMENDPYEKTKNIYMETIKKQNFNPNNVKIEPEPMNNYDRNILAQKKYQPQNDKLGIIEEKPNRYAYLNNYYDNNMNLKNNVNKNKSPINNRNNGQYRPSSQQANINNKYNNNNKSPFSKGNKKDRYQNMFNDEQKPNVNQNQKKRPITNQQEKRNKDNYNNYNIYGYNNNNINRYGNNNRRNQNQNYEKGWFKRNYPEFKYQKQKKAPNGKVNYGKINYNAYCAENKIDKARNYHYYRENGYYNYRNAMNAHKGKQNQGQNKYGNPPENNIYKAMQFGNRNGPNIVNIKNK